jgi:hypothetical protein
MGENVILGAESCKYLGVIIDKNLSFDEHIQSIVSKLSRHCGLLYRLREWLPKEKLIEYYNIYVKPIIQYGVLIYGCTTKSKLGKIIVLQKKILRIIYFKPRMFTTFELFSDAKILTVLELHIYELCKFIFRSLRKEHCSEHLNALYDNVQQSKYQTRSITCDLQPTLLNRTKFSKHSIRNRGHVLINFMRRNKIFPDSIGVFSEFNFQTYIHNFANCFIFQNLAIINEVF